MDQSAAAADEKSSKDGTAKSTEYHDESQALILKTLGNSALAKGHIYEAISQYSLALELTPTSAILLSNRSLAFVKVENYGLAIQDATSAIECDPFYAKAYYRRGSAEFALQKAKAARKDFRKVCQLKPKDRDAREKLAACDKVIKQKLFAAAIVSAETQTLSETYDPNGIEVSETSYDGPYPDGGTKPLTGGELSREESFFNPGQLPRDFVMAAIQRFKDQKLIHKRFVARLLISCKRYFESLPSLLDIRIPKEAPEGSVNVKPRVTVCGDTHGQFYDVMNIFEINGYPSATNPYIFNGDFVDRGSFSLEVIVTYLLFKISDPTSIYLLRGNHETKNMNRIYGFEGEVKAKYDDKIFELFLEVFCHLPLVATIENKVIVTHGGLPVEPTSLADIKKIPRGCEPPESGLMSDLLWSDPQPFPGKAPSKRGVGYSFGPDITKAFLEKNDLNLLVRSHEVKDEGYLVEHEGKCITIFSAPNYCDSMGNKGAFIHFDSTLVPKFTQFEAVPHPDVKPMAYAAGMGGMYM